jgi:hypothetical protein
VIVRRVHDDNEFREEAVVRFGQSDAIDEVKIEQKLTGALRKLLMDDSAKITTERTGSRGQKKLSKKPSRRKRKI